MQKMSGLDLSLAVAELAPLQGKRISKIRRTASGIFLFKIGGEELLFQPGVRLHLTRQSLQATDSPDGFVAFLRKNFEGKTAQEMRQYGTDRILEIATRSKERLVFELFRKGNIIAVGEDGIIVSCLQKDEAGGRRVARGERYVYPKATAFEIKKPGKIAFCVQENGKGEPVSFSLDAAAGGKEFAGFSEMADYYYANQVQESDAQRAASERLRGLNARLASQEETLARLQQEKWAAKKAGDSIYANFEGIDALLSLVRHLKKGGATEEEINRQLASKKARVHGSELELEIE